METINITYDLKTGVKTTHEVDVDVQAIEQLQIEAHDRKLREQRNMECFTVINRGQLWYSTLTEEQLQELTVWYQAWLDVTTTFVIPQKPNWL